MESHTSRRARPHLMARFGALLATLALGATPALAEAGATEIVFTYGADDTGTVKSLIDAFNAEHSGRVHVTWREMAHESNAYYEQLVTELNAAESRVHVIAADVIWTAALAKRGLVRDVTRRFYEVTDPAELIAPALASATWDLRRWGVPWYSDVSVLFYRKDLLAKSGFTTPPATWDALKAMARKVKADAGTKHGFVFQGADYEGGAANAMEHIWGAGGRVMTTRLHAGAFGQHVTEVQAVTIDSGAAARGLDMARSLVAEGVSPAEVATYREREALDAFMAGDAVFLRSWPYVQGVLTRSGFAADKVGVAVLPAALEGGTGTSCLGGWNLMVASRASEAEREAAWTLIRWLIAPAQQRRQALSGGLLPVLRALYADAELASKVPALSLGKQVVTGGLRARPVSPFYPEMSALLSGAFVRVLRGEMTGAQAVGSLDASLRAVLRRNR